MLQAFVLLPSLVGAMTLDAESGPLLMKNPTVNESHITFSFGGDLWVVPREGGDAWRLTSSPGTEDLARYSPDGRWIAFTGTYNGNEDVFVVESTGGVPKRLTFRPEPDEVAGWTRDGKVLFTTTGAGMPYLNRLWTVDPRGARPTMLPYPEGLQGSFSPDGRMLAYVPKRRNQMSWKRYRGGQTTPIWISEVSSANIKEVPRKNSNDSHPMWIGDSVYFLSDRESTTDLYRYDVRSHQVSPVAKRDQFDFKSASEGPGAIVLEELGSIKLYDLASKGLSTVPIRVRGDFPEVRARFVNPANLLQQADISPNGKRVAISARGDLLTAPAGKGDVRNLTQSSDAADRSPAWSPDGRWIASFSEVDGEYKIVLRRSDGKDERKVLAPGDGPSYYDRLGWSPDSKYLSYVDVRCNGWVTEVETGETKKLDTAPLYPVAALPNPQWSPDSKWVTYARQIENFLNAVFVVNVETGERIQVTDGMSDARSPVFDRGGKYLYFTASTNTRNSPGWLDLSSLTVPNVTSSVYLVVLRNDTPSPFLPESDEEAIKDPEPAEGEAKSEEHKKDDGFRIDKEGLDQRVLSVPMPGRQYLDLGAGTPGNLFTLEMPASPNPFMGGAPPVMRKFSLDSRTESVFAPGVDAFAISPNGQHAVLFSGGGLRVVGTGGPPPPGSGAVDLGGASARIDPKAEWRQMFHEALRIQRDFFYDPNHHGVNLSALEAKYEPFLDGLVSRADLNYLLEDMLGELTVGHMYIAGGDLAGQGGVPTGLLGADYEVANGRYRFAKVYNGENWNPNLRAPLTAPGVNVKAGEYLLAVDGLELNADEDIYARFEGKANRQVRLTVGPNPDGSDSREVVVVPTAGEGGLRAIDWVEGNRRRVDELSGGKVGYVWVPNTSVQGFESFNRYYFAQIGKEGVVIDERFNGGGAVSDYFIDMLDRPLMSMWATRYGADFSSPLMSIFGPKALLINEYAGSGGDYFPWAFREAKLGPLVGKRTWGGLVGILGFPPLIDGGFVTSPNLAFYNPKGDWEIENYGVAPDIEVELDPSAWRAGRDAQLDRAVEEVLKSLRTWKRPEIKRPAYPDKTQIK